jgi:hypothetical protein
LQGGGTVKFILVVKKGTETLKEFPGLIDIDPKVSELERIIELERLLEHFLGYRFHINQWIELKRKED